MRRSGCSGWIICAGLWCLCALAAHAESAKSACVRPSPGQMAVTPPELRSANGKLDVTFTLRREGDTYGRTVFCYISGTGEQSPTLRVRPGDALTIHLKNGIVDTSAPMPAMHMHMAA